MTERGDTPPSGFPAVTRGSTPPAGYPTMPPPAPPPPPPSRRRPWAIGLALAVAALLLLWNAGAFDSLLFNANLNRHPCIRNTFGATFCGGAAKSYCQSIAQARDLAKDPNDVCSRLGY